MTPVLSWKEIETLIEVISSEIEGSFLERVIIPERKMFQEGFLKGEWGLRFSNSQTLLLNIRNRAPYLTLLKDRKLKGSLKATRSPFFLEISKYLKGCRLVKVEAVPKERACVFWFSPGGEFETELKKRDVSEKYQGLVLFMIPATPEAVLVAGEGEIDLNKKYLVLTRSRSKEKEEFVFPDGRNSPKEVPFREEWFKTEKKELVFTLQIEKELQQEALDFRKKVVRGILKNQIKYFQKGMKQSQAILKKANEEPDWNHYGSLLKSVIHENPKLKKKEKLYYREVKDYQTGELVQIPCDSKLSLVEQSEKFFHQAKRKKRRLKESNERLEQFTSQLNEFKNLLDSDLENQLDTLEVRLGIFPDSDLKKTKKRKSWTGRSFVSKEGYPIWIGKSKTENQDLTFKFSRGNDYWFHVKGRPGAHGIVPMPVGKSLPLETLLDAATLVLYYSGGKEWGKTEIDYTMRKYVKRIKKSSEVSYTQNKTVTLEVERERIERLLGKSV